MPINDHLPRLTQFIQQGSNLLEHATISKGKRNYWMPPPNTSESLEWISNVGSFLSFIAPSGTYIRQQAEKIFSHEDLNGSYAPVHVIDKLQALLKTTKQDIQEGRLSSWEYNITAQDFDEFLKYAEHFHKGGKKMEAAIIGSAVLEDTIKTIAKKFNNEASGSLEEIIQKLTEAKIFTAVKKTRVQSYATIRNKAFHAKWDEFDLKDVGHLIEGVRGLLDDFIMSV